MTFSISMIRFEAERDSLLATKTGKIGGWKMNAKEFLKKIFRQSEEDNKEYNDFIKDIILAVNSDASLNVDQQRSVCLTTDMVFPDIKNRTEFAFAVVMISTFINTCKE